MCAGVGATAAAHPENTNTKNKARTAFLLCFQELLAPHVILRRFLLLWFRTLPTPIEDINFLAAPWRSSREIRPKTLCSVKSFSIDRRACALWKTPPHNKLKGSHA